MNESVGSNDQMESSAVMGNQLTESISAPQITYHFECFNEAGHLVWEEDIKNLVTTVGRNHLLDTTFGGTGGITYYVGLIDNAGYTSLAATDTMASHGGWTTESVAYSNANRPTLAWNAASGGSKAASTYVEFTINAGATIKGAFVTTNNTKGGTTGVLYSESAFAANRVVISGDFLRVTPTMTIT